MAFSKPQPRLEGIRSELTNPINFSILYCQAKTMGNHLNQVHLTQESDSLRAMGKQLFFPRPELWIATQRCSSFSLSVLFEDLQSMIADSDPISGAIMKPPCSDQISQVLWWTHEKIVACDEVSEVACCQSGSSDEEPRALQTHLQAMTCAARSRPGRNNREHEFDLAKSAFSLDGRKALLHAIAVQGIVETITRGRPHIVHMRSSLFDGAKIYAAAAFAGKSGVRIPKTIGWEQTVSPSIDLESA